jgi:hypothetical protein
MMDVFYHRNYAQSHNRFALLQDYVLQPLMLFLGFYALMLVYLIAGHKAVLWPGIGGILISAVLGTFFGMTRARAAFLEIGFSGDFFYMRSAYEIAFQKNYKYYPLQYANITREGSNIYLNYIEQTVRLHREDWEHWNTLWERFHGIVPFDVA